MTNVFDLLYGVCFLVWWVAGRLYREIVASVCGRMEGLERKT